MPTMPAPGDSSSPAVAGSLLELVRRRRAEREAQQRAPRPEPEPEQVEETDPVAAPSPAALTAPAPQPIAPVPAPVSRRRGLPDDGSIMDATELLRTATAMARLDLQDFEAAAERSRATVRDANGDIVYDPATGEPLRVGAPMVHFTAGDWVRAKLGGLNIVRAMRYPSHHKALAKMLRQSPDRARDLIAGALRGEAQEAEAELVLPPSQQLLARELSREIGLARPAPAPADLPIEETLLEMSDGQHRTV